MKMSRTELKEIVKECLVEILSEGMGSSKLKESLQRHDNFSRKHPNEFITYAQKSTEKRSIIDRKKINEVIKAESNGDPIMASILADTASTTLPNMLMNENNKQMPMPAGSIESVVATHKPEDLFGDEAASKWATLAFMDAPKKF